MSFKLLAFFSLLLFGCSDISLAQEAVTAIEPVCSGVLCQVLKNFPEVNAWLLVLFPAIALILRGIADILVFVGAKVQNKSTSDVGSKINSCALWAAQVVGWLGAGTPKAVIQKKVENELGKQGTPGPTSGPSQ